MADVDRDVIVGYVKVSEQGWVKGNFNIYKIVFPYHAYRCGLSDRVSDSQFDPSSIPSRVGSLFLFSPDVRFFKSTRHCSWVQCLWWNGFSECTVSQALMTNEITAT